MTHRVEWTLDDLGVTTTFTCAAHAYADCRMVCAHGCDDGCQPDDDGTPHPREPIDYCNPCEWLNNGVDAWETYAGGRTAVRDGAVVPAWTDGDYQWDYAQEATP